MSAAPADAAVRECGNAGSIYNGAVTFKNVTSRGVRCSYARPFAKALYIKGGSACDEGRICWFRGWRCRNVTIGRWAGLDRRCTKGQYVIRHQSLNR